MTSSFLARHIATAAIAAVVAFGGTSLASDAPAPARQGPAASSGVRAFAVPARTERVRIARATVRAIDARDPIVAKLLPQSDWGSLRQPLLVSVEVVAAFTNPERTASPVIIVNGHPIGDSSVPADDRTRVLAIVRDGSQVRSRLTIQVGWLGALEATTSAPITVEVDRG